MITDAVATSIHSEDTVIDDRVVIIGAGVGGLVAATLLAARGYAVTVIEKEQGPGGKVRRLPVGDTLIDAGPTVFTLRSVFDDIFASAGTSLDRHVTLERAEVIARHAWSDAERLDLYDDAERSTDAIGTFAGADAARGYRAFRAAAARVFNTLDHAFLRQSNTNPLGLTRRIGLGRVGDLLALRPYESLWSVLGEFFPDPRLHQLFARYSTYCGSSPFRAPSTLMLIAHVEASGVWLIQGGLSALATALEGVARSHGAQFRFGVRATDIGTCGGRAAGVTLSTGEHLPADAVIANVDPAALGAGLLGPAGARAVPALDPKARSLSALVWIAHTRAAGFPLARHNVFFSRDYPAEFRALHARRLAPEPSVYICALDRNGTAAPDGRERFQIIVNAPAMGDAHRFSPEEIDRCSKPIFERLNRCGLALEQPCPMQVLTPADFERLCPSTGGALYGRASHGWAASFLRQSARTRIPGLYCAGGSTHPGAGVPMAALSAGLAVKALMADRASTARSRRAATAGGTRTRSATAGASA